MRRWIFSSGAALVGLQLSSVSHCGGPIGGGPDSDTHLLLIDGISANAIIACGGFVYWVGSVCDGKVPTGDSASLNRIPIAGGANEIVAGNVSDGRSIVCDGRAVYFWQNLDQLAAAPLDGSAPFPVAVGVSNPGILATNDTSIFWAGASGVYTLTDGGVTLLSNVDGPSGIAASDDHVYWMASFAPPDGGGLLAESLDGGPPNLLWAGESNSRLGLTSSHVYWMQYFPASLMQVELGGGSVSTLLADAGATSAHLSPIVTDGTDVYWSSMTEVHRVGVDGTGDAILFALGTGSFAVADLAVDETSLYVSIETAPIGLPCGSIVKTAK